MIFLEYEKLKKQYLLMQDVCDQILREKESYFTKTQPNAIRYDKVNVKGGKHENGFDQYLEECESHHINQRLNEAITILQARGELLKLKEEELRASKDILDVVFVMKNLDNAKVSTIAKALDYTEGHIYRMLEKIKKLS